MSIDNAGSNYTIVVAGDSISEGIIYDEKKKNIPY
jgi:hypothetical protein